jgi:tetratricopeptide (TPR) repeat protein/O-antigen ligase
MSIHHRLIWIVLAAVLVTAPLYFGGVTPEYSLAATGIVSLLAFSLFLLRDRARPLEMPRSLVLALLAFTAGLALAGALSRNLRVSLEDVLYWLGMVLVFCLAAQVCGDLPRWRRLALGLTIVAAGVAFWGLWNWLLDVHQVWGVSLPPILQGVHGTFVNRNHFAGYLSMVLPFSLVTLLQARSLPARILLGICTAVLVAAIAFSLSRGAWAGTATALLAMGGLAWVGHSGQRRKRWIMVLPAVVLLGLFLRIGLEPVFLRIEHSLIAQQVESVGSRIEIWKSAVEMFSDHPIAGAGPGMYGWLFPAYRPPGLNGHAWYAHNDYLQFLAEGGLVLGLAGAGLLIVLLRLLGTGFMNSRRPMKRQLFLAATASLLAIAVEIGFDFQLHCHAIAVTLAVVLGAAAGNIRNLRTVSVPYLAFAPAALVAVGAIHLWIAAVPLGQARTLLVGNMPADGLADLDLAIALDPLNSEPYEERAEFWTARTRSGVGKYEAFLPAWASYQEAIRLFPQVGLYRLRAGMLLEAGWRLGQMPLSGPSMRRILQAMRTTDQGVVQKVASIPERILTYYREALARDPNNPYFHDVMAVALLRSGDLEGARRHIEESIFLDPGLSGHAVFRPYFGDRRFREMARVGLRRALARDPRQPAILRILARWDLEEGQTAAAARLLAQAGGEVPMEEDPEWTELSAEVAVRDGRADQALQIWKRHCAASGWSRTSLEAAVRFFLGMKDREAALQFIDQVRTAPGAPDCLFYLEGEIREANGQAGEAIAAYELYRRQNPDDRQVLDRLTRLYLRDGDPVRAEEAIRRIMRVYPGEPTLYLSLSQTLLAQGLVDQAIQELHVAVGLFPEEVPLWELLARLQKQQQNHALAAEAYLRLSELDSTNRQAELEAARNFYLAGEREQSLTIYRRLLERNPTDSDLRREFSSLRF